jgi:predicted HAD superfamily Cof-like phosphohydrolase
MNSMFSDVGAFHEKVIGLEQSMGPTLIGEKFGLERFRFLMEEADEYFEATVRGDMVGAIDGLVDTIYVALGTLWQMGIDEKTFNACWAAVQKANMAKERGVTKRGNQFDAVKPSGWVGPEAAIAAALVEAIDS